MDARDSNEQEACVLPIRHFDSDRFFVHASFIQKVFDVFKRKTEFHRHQAVYLS